MIQEFLTYISKVRNLSAATIDGYKKDLALFVDYFLPQQMTWRSLRKSDIDGWLMDMERAGLKPATRNRRLASVRSLLTWAHHEGIIPTNPARFCQQAKLAETTPKALSVAQVDKYLKQQHTSTLEKVIAALISLMLETGARIGEALAIEQRDINREEKSIILNGKGKRQRKVYYGQRTEKHLSVFIADVAGGIFPSWHQQFYRAEIEKALYQSTGHMTPHQLRHTFATSLLNNGADITTVSYLLGHKHIETTQRYAKVSNPHAKEVYQQTMF